MLRERCSRHPAMTIKIAAIVNTHHLCSESPTNQGRLVINVANAAPSPSMTKSAGNAQQISVAELDIKANMTIRVFLFDFLKLGFLVIIFNLPDAVA